MRNFVAQHTMEKSFFYDRKCSWVPIEDAHVFKTEKEFKDAVNLQASRGKFSVMHKLWKLIEVSKLKK